MKLLTAEIGTELRNEVWYLMWGSVNYGIWSQVSKGVSKPVGDVLINWGNIYEDFRIDN